MTKIAIISRPAHRSPRILAESLEQSLRSTKSLTKVYFKLNAFKRLLSYEDVKHKYPIHLWLVYKMLHLLSDWIFIHRLKSYDAIIISDCAPLGFFKDTYDIERLRILIGEKPIIFYEVYYLGNAPTQLDYLKKSKMPSLKRYDWHLSVTDVTEIRQKPNPPWSQIGLNLKSTGLKPEAKEKLLAIVDFAQPGYEQFRENQIKVLNELNIPYISFEREYSLSEIRGIYRKATFYFMQSFEAFGLPIAECLSCGSYIFTPDSSWPMSWRLDENPQVHGPGLLPDCFVVYDSQEDLRKKLKGIMNNYDFKETPKKVFNTFYTRYPTFYEGNAEALKDLLNRVDQNMIEVI